LRERSVAPTPEALAGLARLSPPLPEKGLAPEAVLALLDEAGSPAALEDAALAWLADVLGLPAGTGAIR
jgi:hypothetical protein